MKHKVAVIGRGSEARVIPAALVVSRYDDIEIAGIDCPISVWFPWMPPEKSVWQGDADNRVILKIDQEPGVYEYSVYHKDTHIVVQGNSSPKIIITR